MTAEKQVLIVTPKQVVFSIASPEDVFLRFDIDGEDTGLLGLDLVIRMSPSEARKFGKILARKADEAEAGVPRC